MVLQQYDWLFIIGFFIISILIGVITSKTASKSFKDFFLSGRNMPWWLLGISMVATTFSADTPNLVTDIVRQNGISGNWVWWAFLLTGMLTVFVYAKLWRRSEVLTDLEFYELRYSGKEAAFLRGFRAIYLGVFFNVMIMATVSLAAIKIGGVMLGISPIQTIFWASLVTVIYSSLGGLKGVMITDFFQFIIAMIGAVWAAYIAVNLPQVGGLSKLLVHENVIGKLNFLPDFSNWETLVPLLILPLAVQWWSVWYPGAEPGGGGYIAQRMLSAKNEKSAVAATFMFNVMHYALRPWPWILVGLASLIVFPDIASLQAAFPDIDPGVVKNDLAYPAMLTFLPAGLLGLVIASLIAAYMSTISTHLNWGASYVVNDFYKRFLKPDASEKELVMVGRISTVILMVLAGFLALLLSNALQAFNILLQIGAGTGLLFILRWFWWRVNAWSEIAAMVVSFLMALYLELIHVKLGFEAIDTHWKLLIGVGVTSLAWILVAFVTPPASMEVMKNFVKKINPGGPGWRHVEKEMGRSDEEINSAIKKWDVPRGILAMMLGVILVYSALFATGFWIYGNTIPALVLSVVVVIVSIILGRMVKKISFQ
jgi:SSS family solute:Na+ symporter